MIDTQSDILRNFFDEDDFAEKVAVNGNFVSAIFDYANIIDESGGIPVYLRTPILTIRDEDLFDVEQGDIVAIRDKVYKISSIEPYGTGISVVNLIIKNQ